MANVNIYSKEQIDAKFQEAPATAGTNGQVLGLNASLEPVWINQSGGGGGVTLSIDDIASVTKGMLTAGGSNGGVPIVRLLDTTAISTSSANPSTITVLGESVQVYTASTARIMADYLYSGSYFYWYNVVVNVAWNGQNRNISWICYTTMID